MDFSELLKSLSANQKVLFISFIIRFPIIYTIAYMISPDFRIMEMFPQIMFTAAYSVMTASIEALILEFAGMIMGFKRYRFFPSVYTIILLFVVFNLCYLNFVISIRYLIGCYILSIIGAISGCLLTASRYKEIINSRIEQEGSQKTDILD